MGPWVKEGVHFLDVLAIDVRIDLRRGNISMAEHLLNSAQVCSTLKKVSREGVTKHMWMHMLRKSGVLCCIADDFPDAHARQWTTTVIEEQYVVGTCTRHQLAARFRLVAHDPAHSFAAYGYETLLRPFAEDPYYVQVIEDVALT